MKTKKTIFLSALFGALSLSSFGQETYKPELDRSLEEMKILLPYAEEEQSVMVEIVDEMVVFEGDIVLGTKEELEEGELKSALITGKDRHWRGAVVPYVIASNHPKRSTIISAINYINTNTDARLVARTNQADYVEIINGSGCWSYVGRQGGKQQVSIGSCSWGSTVHELAHAIGLYHEQSRADRDSYVTINYANIQSGKEHNFNKYSTGIDIGGYDYGSIMHYGAYAFSSNGKPTIVSKIAGKTFGQRSNFSAGDINGINAAVNPDVWHDRFCFRTEIPKVGDFNGDGRDDIVTFTRSTTGDAFVALSNGKRFNGTGVRWHGSFCYGSEIPLVGDFNGDKKDDIATFTRGTTADVFVALSTGRSFSGNGVRWHGSFCYGSEIPLVGDFNGDGKDDIVTFTRGNTADVYVALSTGSRFNGTAVRWHGSFCYGTEIPLVGDFNGDGKDDIATFTRGGTGDVYVALSNGRSFVGTSVRWNGAFCYNSQLPFVVDLNKDGKDDIVSFTRGSSANVYAAISNGRSFVKRSGTWLDWFASGTQLPETGDFNGDGYGDLIAFNRGSLGDVFVAVSGRGVPGQSNQSNDAFADVAMSDETDAFSAETNTKVSLFPNPTSGKLSLSFNAESASVAVVKCVDMFGKIAFETKLDVTEGVNVIELDLSALQTGVYGVELNKDGEVIKEQVMLRK